MKPVMSQAEGAKGSGYRVVVGVDYSELSRLALCTALNLAEKQRGTLHVITVAEGYGPPLPKDLIDDEKRLFLEEARETLQKYVEEQAGAVTSDSSSLPIEIRAEIGNAADHIIALAGTAHADLIVIGIAGRRGITEALMGNAAQRVLRHAGCSVLVVRPKPA
jgi:nucleotide-binding universal stress UspA family protein